MFSRVILSAETILPELFLNKCLKNGISVGDTHMDGERRLIIETTPKNARMISALASEYSIPIKIIRVSGIKAAVMYLKRRPTLPLAFAAFALITVFFLSRVWFIEIRDLGGTPPTAIAEADRLARDTRDTSLLALKLRALNGIAYASATRDGVYLTIELSGENSAPEVFDITRPRDLAAACDAVIASVNVKSGTAMVKPGDTVRKGQTLISGEERISADETRPVAALGSVTARCWVSATAEASIYDEYHMPTGEVSISEELKLFGLNIPLSTGREFEHCDVQHVSMPIVGLFVPLCIDRTIRAEYVPQMHETDVDVLREALLTASQEQATAEIQAKHSENAEIIDKWTDFSMIDTDTLRAETVIEFVTEIAVTRGYLEEN